MTAPTRPRAPVTRSTNYLRMGLRCANNVFAMTDRRMPEAAALAEWLQQNATPYGLDDADLPDDDSGRKRRGVPAVAWRKIGASLQAASDGLPPRQDACIDLWLAAFARALGLDPLESDIFSLGLHYRLDKRVDRLFDALSECRGGPSRFHRDAALIGMLLDAPTAEVDARLAPEGKLQASGLFRLERDGELEVLDRLVSLIRQDVPPAGDLYDQILGEAAPDPLPWDAFAHLGQEAEVAAAILRSALAGNETGVNILLYGPPGTGKTSFAATLAQRIGASLRPVAEVDDYGGEPSRFERLAGLRLAQRLAAGRGSLLLFDEAEDLFVSKSYLDGEPVASSRVFVHRLLERMTVPVIWTANDIRSLGPAVLRRMTMCIELKVPNLVARTRLWRQMGDAEGVALAEPDAARLARLVPAAPAVASTALRAARLAGGQAEAARVIVEGVAKAVRGGALPAPEAEQDALYDPALVNADCDLPGLLARLERPGADRAVSFLLSGPPGSGKSAWVRHLAQQMGMQVLQKRASDILDPFVGGSERNIADAFAQAREAGAFLVFDEADSLLLDRADAVRSWEVTQVNEMLTWMEQHALPFACTTNLVDRLDRASLRRFLVKVRFDWLTAEQVRLAFDRFFGMGAPPETEALRTLTPADFALVRRRAALSGVTDGQAIARLLAAEAEGRVGGRGRVGF